MYQDRYNWYVIQLLTTVSSYTVDGNKVVVVFRSNSSCTCLVFPVPIKQAVCCFIKHNMVSEDKLHKLLG